MKVRLSRLADAEVDQIHAWYDAREPGLGATPNMRVQVTRPRELWPAAERWTSASLQLIRGR